MTLDHLRQQRRRASIVGAMALLLLLVIVFVLRPPAPGRAAGDDPYAVELAQDTNPHPTTFETTIVADEATIDIGNGVSANAQAFNGTVPGPEFRLNVGDTVIVHFENRLDDEVTGIHWHGIELANASDGTPLTQNQVPPGGKFLYKFKVSRPGIFWYHPHHHASTNQVFKGLIGSIIVKDANEEALQGSGVLPPESQTRTLALNDTTICKAPGSNDARTYNTVPANGPVLPHVSGAPLPAQPGPWPAQLCETGAVDDDGNPRPAFAEGDIPNVQKAGTSGRVNEGQTVLTNGIDVGGRAGTPQAPGALDPDAKTLDVQAGQGLRLRLGNETVVRFFRLILTDDAGNQIPLVRVGGQGGILDEAIVEGGVVGGFDFKFGSGEILVDPGDRQDVVVAIPPAATGVLTLWTQDFERTGQGFANIPTVPVAHFKVTGTASSPYTIGAGTDLLASIPGQEVETLGAPTDTLLDPSTFTPPKTGMSSQNIRLTGTGASLGVDDEIGQHDFAGDYKDAPHEEAARYAKLGDTLELTVENTTQAHHPFHLHGFSIQPIELTSPGSPTYTWPYREFRDNIDIPAGYALRYRVRLDDRPLIDGVTPGGGVGRWVFHCHIFFHAVFGMISEFDVVAPNGNERPYVNADTTSVAVDEGQAAETSGTFKDPGGDTVTLAASIGTVTKNSGGAWSWSYPTTDGPQESQLVYITATDAAGQKDQAVFSLTVNNRPPSLAITSPPDGSVLGPAPANVTVTASITDPGSGDSPTCRFNWNGGGPDSSSAAGGGTCSQTNTFTQGGVFTVTVTGEDGDGGASSDSVVVRTGSPGPQPLPAALRLQTARLSVFGRTGGRARCRMRRGRTSSCAVRVLSGRQLIATGSRRSSASRRSLVVRLRLTRAGKTLLGRRLGGVRTRLRARAATSGGVRRAGARTRAILRAEHFTTPAGSWLPDQATLTARGRSFVRRLRGKLVAVAGLRCDGYEANVRPRSARTSRRSLARAATMCAALRELGVNARSRLVGHGDADPIASNAGESGRAKNRRVEVTVTHKRRPLPSSRSRTLLTGQDRFQGLLRSTISDSGEGLTVRAASPPGSSVPEPPGEVPFYCRFTAYLIESRPAQHSRRVVPQGLDRDRPADSASTARLNPHHTTLALLRQTSRGARGPRDSERR
jgi:FtsP/CotA-like multicopper oxidase with cupredoxin domain